MKKGIIVLEDGRKFEGVSFGAEGEAFGELVFNTSMSGYQEILTDPSYKGQIVTMTYPLIGNYGVNHEDVESDKPQVEGFVVREYCQKPSNFRAAKTLGDYLIENNIVAIERVDTRALVRHIRNHGVMKAVISTRELDSSVLLEKVKAWPGLEDVDLVKMVTCPGRFEVKPKHFDYHVVAIDYGMKKNILRMF